MRCASSNVTPTPLSLLFRAVVLAIAAFPAIAASQTPSPPPIGVVRPSASTTPASASAPATTASSGAAAASKPAALQAETILKSFPANAGSLPSRSDARNFSVEGRVRDVRTDTITTGTGTAAATITETKIVLVGRAQSDETLAHFTCHLDKSAETAAADLKPDQIVRLTGTIGAITPAADRIDLKACHDLSVTGELNAGDQLPGIWRCASVMQDGAALRKANQSKGVKNDNTPNANFLSSLELDIEFKTDAGGGTLNAELRDKDQLIKKLAGKWSILKDNPNEVQLRLSIPGSAPQEITATFENKSLKLVMPGFADKFVLPDLACQKVVGKEFPVDWKNLEDQTLRWISTNNVSKDQGTIQKFTSDLIESAPAKHVWYGATLGSALVRRAKSTTLLGVYGRLIVLEHSDVETQMNTGIKTGFVSLEFPQAGIPMAPEVKVEAFTVDNRNALDPAKGVTGKITLRNMRRPIEAQYSLVMTIPGGGAQVILPRVPGPDSETYPFAFPAIPPGAPNPRVAVFVVVRKPLPGDQSSTDPSPRVVSEPLAVLLDLAK